MDKDVLLVDDEELILTALDQVFRARGYTPHTASSGEQALEILKHCRIQVIYLDLRMPGMDGMTLCREIKQTYPDTHVYALSAFIGAFTPEQFADAGFEGCFNKPFKIDEIMRAGEEAFEKIEAAAGAIA